MWTAIQHPSHANWTTALSPISATLTYATPLILAGPRHRDHLPDEPLQHRRAGPAHRWGDRATFVGFTVIAPAAVLIPLEVLAGIAGGLLVASVPGVLKAYTGAHEVIVTIMMNYVCAAFLAYLVLANGFKRPNESGGRVQADHRWQDSFPKLLGWLSSTLQVNVGLPHRARRCRRDRLVVPQPQHARASSSRWSGRTPRQHAPPA